jgi:spoIIIJ-associated protein
MDSKTIELVSNTLSEILEKLQFPFTRVEVLEEENSVIRANIETDRVPFLIGVHGERINALQHILKNVLWKKGAAESVFVVIDVDNYKKSREEKILRMAAEKANMARAMRITQIMPPLDPYLRKLVHTQFTKEEFSDIKTESVGEGTARRLHISVA